MSNATYDPFAVERPVIRLGAHGSWTLGDITDSRHKRITEWYAKHEAMKSDTSLGIADLARIVGGLLEIACIGGDGIPDLLADLTDEEKHGDDALGMLALNGCVQFVMDHLIGEESAGNA